MFSYLFFTVGIPESAVIATCSALERRKSNILYYYIDPLFPRERTGGSLNAANKIVFFFDGTSTLTCFLKLSSEYFSLFFLRLEEVATFQLEQL